MQSSKEAVRDELERLTTRYGVDEPQLFQASNIAEHLHISRSLASQYMNALHGEGELIKVSTRPALFFSRRALERRNAVSLSEFTFLSLEELRSHVDRLRSKRYGFEDVIGVNGSCRSVIEGIKAAACYPPRGLPLLLVGNEGSGKSLIRRAAARWCVSECIIDSEDDCIELDAAVTPASEMLASLFGDAASSRVGLLASAQTKLVWVRNCQLFDGTVWTALLSYFESASTRCTSRLFFEGVGTLEAMSAASAVASIPITCQMPDFSDRELDEREAYVYRAFQDEATRIGRTVLISSGLAQRLASR